MNKFLKVFARKEVALALAGVGVSTLTGWGGYVFGKKRERERILALYVVDNLVREDEFAFMEKMPLPVKEGIDEIIRQYGPQHYPDVEYNSPSTADFERVATPLADEILGKTEVVEPLDTEEYNEPTEFDQVEAVVYNIFASASKDSSWDYDAEIANRMSARPYVIHQDEFINKDSGFDQSTLTYFAKDGVVVDELNEPLEDWVSTLGQLKFGHGTTDANAVYIRNEKLQEEFEVLLSTGAYLDEVIGQEAELEIERDELKHSMNMRMRRE